MRNELLPSRVRIYENFNDLVLLQLDKDVSHWIVIWSSLQLILSGRLYSPVWYLRKSGIWRYIEEKINQIVEEYENIDIMLVGDFSARSGELDDSIMTDSTEFVPE